MLTKLRLLSNLSDGLSYESYVWVGYLRRVQKNMSSTASWVTVISVQDASNASPVNLSLAIVDLNHVLRRRSIENCRSADAVVFGKVVITLSSEM